MSASHVCGWMLLVLAGWYAAGCTAGTDETPPTLIPVAKAPELLERPAAAVAPTESDAAAPQIGSAPAANGDETLGEILGETLDDFPPTPAGVGLRPLEARQQFVRDAGPEAPIEWRPPPYEVPLSRNPDDHYWLSRPIPSNRRNYDLEWYPFGNDVQIPALAPYRIHHGIDMPNEQGTSILAAGSGTVIHAGPLPSPRNGVNYYGNTVIIHHDWQWRGQDVYTLYAHTLELFVEVGEHVRRGELIAGVGSSGEVTQSHLHLEVRVGANNYGATRNPALWLAPYEGWGTLAGRFVDRRGRMIPGATINVTSVDGDMPPRVQQTYSLAVRSDDLWRENFVVGDLPAGRYTLLVSVNGITYQRDVTIFPGQTTFEIIGTLFEYVPPPTPTPAPTAEEASAAGESETAAESTPTP